ncbi:hypothetical protein SPHINGO8BC_260002 [Sphingobacterium multivorum]|uniref:Uncharacterized protein n=1 Tax=Sphingobacterium multivorum TaxID=28454 RepID=A0A654BDG0_SPHMU|nr:hypothetical protein SPHINGO8BC_260002 [Sphingobacterium multivorum]
MRTLFSITTSAAGTCTRSMPSAAVVVWVFSVMVMSFATLSGSDRVRVLAISGCRELRTRSFLWVGLLGVTAGEAPR